MLNVGIIGATGYTGEELVEILLRHGETRITNLSAKIEKPERFDSLFPRFKGKIDLVCKEPDLKEIITKSDLVFLALPHTVSMLIAPKLLAAQKKVIDLSADYRLKDTKVYSKFYNAVHKDKINLAKAVYGLPEIYRLKIKKAQFVANPGCYPTAAILALAPAIALKLVEPDSVIIDAKSGVTGAGRKASLQFFFSEINENFKAYKVNCHQHAPEINQELSKFSKKKIEVLLVPHLLPLDRGILETIYLKKKENQAGEVKNIYKKFYKNEPFVRIRDDDLPELKDVVNTNFCDIAIKEDKDNIIIISVIDNLLKGAAGQAVQNMNIMSGFPEFLGLV